MCTQGARCCGALAFSLQGEVAKDQACVSIKCWWLLEQSRGGPGLACGVTAG